MSTVEQIRIVRIQGRAEGMEIVSNALNKVADANIRVKTTSDGMAIATERQASKTLSLTRAWDSFQARADMGSRAAQTFGRDVSALTRFFEQGIISTERYSEEFTRLKNVLQGGLPGGNASAARIDQSELNSLLGIKGLVKDAAKASSETFVQEFARLDKLREKFDPVYTAQMRYKGALEEIGAAERLGVISTNLASEARLKESSVLATQIAAIERLSAARKADAQSAVNKQTIVPDRASDIAAYGAELDQLRQKFSPLFTAQTEYRNQLSEIRRAERVGAISTSEMARAIEDTKVAFVARVRQLDGTAAAETRAAASAAQAAKEQADAAALVAKAHADTEAKAVALRTAINPLGTEFARVGKQMAEYRSMQRAGIISEYEYSQASALAARRLGDFEKNLKSGAGASRVMTGELTNLGYQLNDVITGLVTGQSPFMIFGQQAGQIIQIVQSSKASLGEIAREAGSRLVGALTAGRLAFGGIATAALAGVVAFNKYDAAQRNVSRSLAGMGRASGLSATDINSSAETGSSLTGMSTAGAREFASTLAATGRIGREALEPLVKLGHDFASTMGLDASEAAETLAKGLTSGIQGADELNSRLGFLNASMRSQLESLYASNQQYEAQKIIISGLQSSLLKASEVTSIWSMGWTAVKNSASNFFDYVGHQIAYQLNVGLPMEESLKRSKEMLEQYKSGYASYLPFARQQIEIGEKEIAQTETLIAARRRLQSGVAADRDSIVNRATVGSSLPELETKKRLEDAALAMGLLQRAIEATGGASSDILKRMNVSWDQFSQSVTRATDAVSVFRSANDKIAAANAIAMKAITAYSPSDKGQIAYEQAMDSFKSQIESKQLSRGEALARSEEARAIAIKNVTAAIAEQRRERALAAEQALASSKLEISLVGESIGRQTELRANLQTYNTLYQEAARQRLLVNGQLNAADQAEYERLKLVNEELGKRAQLRGQTELQRDISFERSQIGLTDSEQGINSRLRQIYGDKDLYGAQAEFYRQQLKVNDALRSASDIGREAFTGIAQALRDGKLELSELTSILDRVASKLIDMGTQGLWQSAFGGGSSSGGGFLSGLGSLFGFGGSSNSAPTMVTGGMGSNFAVPTFAAANGGTFGRGWGVVGERGAELINVHSAGVTVYSNPVSRGMMANLPGFANGGGLDLTGRVFPASPAPANNNSGESPPVVFQDNSTYHIGEGVNGMTAEQIKQAVAISERQRRAEIVKIVRDARERGHL